jgi:hypothetical protein
VEDYWKVRVPPAAGRRKSPGNAPISFNVHGVFGDAAPPIGVPDYSVATINMTC